MLEVDPVAGRVVGNDEIRDRLAGEKPYRDWLDEETIDVADLPETPREEAPVAPAPLAARLAAYGWHYDDVDEVVRPMAEKGAVPLASMGVDAPLACLSTKTRSFFDYFNQLFAQVTNPPIDALRESLVTSTVLYLGNHGNLLEDCRDSCRLVRLPGPMLSRADFERIRAIDRAGFRAETVRAVYPSDGGDGALERALDELARAAERDVRSGANIVVISDRAGAGETPIPSLLALGCVHNHLIRCGLRTRADLVVETGDALCAHDFACLVGYSASGIYPYLAHDCIADLCARGELSLAPEEACSAYDRAVTAGIVSIMSKMGISTMQGYHSAQIFEVLGLSDELVEKYFTFTATRVGGLTVADLQRELDARAAAARAQAASPAPDQLPTLGLTKWRPGRRGAPHRPEGHLPAAARLPRGRLRPLQGVLRVGPPPRACRHPARPHGICARRRPGAARRGGAREQDRASLQHRCDELRLDQPRAARVPGHRDEPPARALQHRRGRRGPGPRDGASQRRLRMLGDQAGGLGALRRDEPLPLERDGDPDQDGPGRQARRGRPPARPQGLPVDRRGAPVHAGRRAHLAAAPPRHLLDRGPRRADL